MTPHASPTNLPNPLTTMVGREQEAAAVAQLVISHRLVTLVGPLGVGKTRLAVHVARQVADSFPGGTWMADLSALPQGSLVPQAVASAMSVVESTDQTVTDALVDRLSNQVALLVLDNCEHLLEACADIVSTLLGSSPMLTVLATSREGLQVGGEVLWQVTPLTVPSIGASLQELVTNDALQLFIDRVPHKEFPLTEEAALSITEICRRLDGLPLAIELAAGRVGPLTPEQILARLDERFELLISERRDVPHNHHALHAALQSSHELLSESEQMLLRRLSVFTGSFTLTAADEVCEGEGMDRMEVLRTVSGLISKSLLVTDISAAQARYHLLNSVRHYARERLEVAGEVSKARNAHAGWCVDIVRRSVNLSSAEQGAWLQELEAQQDDLRAALEWALGDGDHTVGLGLAGGLVRFWLAHGNLSEGREWLQRALSLADGAVTGRGTALWGAGLMACLQGDLAAALPDAEEALVLARNSNDIKDTARSLNLLGVCRVFIDPTAAVRHLEEAVTLADESGERICLAASLGILGFAQALCGDLDVARSTLEEGVMVGRSLGSSQHLAITLVGLGYVAAQRGDGERAQAALEEGLTVADPLWTAIALAFLAELAANRGDYLQARQFAAEGELLASETSSRPVLALCLVSLGHTKLADGDVRGASIAFRRAGSLAETGGQQTLLGRALAGRGAASVLLGDRDEADVMLANALEVAKGANDRLGVADTMHWLGRLAREHGDDREALGLYLEALRLEGELGTRPAFARLLEALATIALESGDAQRAARLLAVAESVRARTGWVRTAKEDTEYQARRLRFEDTLTSEERSAAQVSGSHMSTEDAVRFACRGHGPRRRPSRGWASLTPSERQVVSLVAEGFSNPRVAERLCVSARTVQTHLTHVFRKLGISSRTQLARDVARRGGSTGH